MVRFAEQVSKNLIPTLNKEVDKMENIVTDQKFIKEDTLMEKAIEELEAYDATVKKFEEDSVKYRQYEMTLGMPETKFENL